MHVIGNPRTFLSRRFIGRSGLPIPFSPLKTLCPVPSRTLVSRAMSSQKRSTRYRTPCSVRNTHRLSICVVLPAPSTPEKLTDLTFCEFCMVIVCSEESGPYKDQGWL